MGMTQNVILDFTHVYPRDISDYVKGLRRIDLSDIEGTNLFCSAEAEAEIRRRLADVKPQGIHFLDNGNYHYMTKFFVEKIQFPFTLFLFDYHNDMQKPRFTDLTECGSWAWELLKKNSYLQQMVLIGPDQKSIEEIPAELREKVVCVSIQELDDRTGVEKLREIQTRNPAYISIDKDVLDQYSARTNWNQGNMSLEVMEKLLSDIFMHLKVIGVDICGECDIRDERMETEREQKVNEVTNIILYHFLASYFPYQEENEEVVMKEYEKETNLWNSVYQEEQAVDLRSNCLTVEPLFDACLKKFAEKTCRIIDYGCGSGDVLFQYHQYNPKGHGMGIDESERGILFAKETAKLSGYRTLHFFQENLNFLDALEEEAYDGVILSNVLDVMPAQVAEEAMEKLNRRMKNGGYWFVKLNPVYSERELIDMGYEEISPGIYGENGVMRLRQESTNRWMEFFQWYGAVENYVEFEYPWQPGLNRLFLIRKE